MPMSYSLPAKIPSHLLRLSLTYGKTEKTANLKPLIEAAKVFIVEGQHYDNWNGGTYGHEVRLFLPIETLADLTIADQQKYSRKILEDLQNSVPDVGSEFVSSLSFDIDNENDPECRQAQPISKRHTVDPDKLDIWEKGLVRVFISHRDEHKQTAQALADSLASYGFSSFVAHDTIAPMAEWRHEIMRGLETMEIMLAFITDDFHESTWTNQEIGYALGACKPIVGLKLGKKDPPGFISHIQAVKAHIDEPLETAKKLYPHLTSALGIQGRLQAALVQAFAESPSWSETTQRFDRMVSVVNQLTEKELQTIVQGYYRNDQLYGASYLTHRNHFRLKKFLFKATGKEFLVDGRKIFPVEEKDDIPF